MLNNTLELQRATLATDSQGGITETWVSQGTFSARINPISAAEKLVADKVTADATHVIYAEAIDVRENDRLVWDSKWTFLIMGIKNPSEGYHHLQIYAKEID